MTHDPRDIELGAALQELPVPEHRPGFFEALTAEMSDVEVAARPEETKGNIEITTLIPKPKEAPTKPRFAHRWAWAVAAAAVVIVAVGLTAALLPGGEDFVEETLTTVATTATTLPSTPTTSPSGAMSTQAYAEAPSFTGTVQYSYTGAIAWEAIVTIGFAGPMKYETDVAYSIVWEDGLAESFFGDHTRYAADGTSMWRHDNPPGAQAPLFLGEIDIWRHLFFDSEAPGPDWGSICGSLPNILGSETLLGRPVVHLDCGIHELWIDTASGLVLKMSGPVDYLDFAPVVGSSGGFEFTQLEFEPVAAPEHPIPAEEWQRATVFLSQNGEFTYEGPSELRGLTQPVPLGVTFEQEVPSDEAFVAFVVIAQGWTYEEFLEYAAAAGLTFVDLAPPQLPDWVVAAGVAEVDAGVNVATFRIPWLDNGRTVHLLAARTRPDLRIHSPEVRTLAVIEVHLGQTEFEGSYSGPGCGFAPEGLPPDRTMRVTRTPKPDGSGHEYTYEGPAAIAAGEAVFLHRITDSAFIGRDGSSYAALFGFMPGYTWDDLVSSADELGLSSLRAPVAEVYGSWNPPEWVVFDAALETGCEGSFASGILVNLVPGQYVVAADMIPGIYEISPDQVVATFEVTP